jgi:FAD:protein FMN transferase
MIFNAPTAPRAPGRGMAPKVPHVPHVAGAPSAPCPPFPPSASPGLAPLRPPVTAQGSWMQREQTAMGTSVTVQVWAEDRSRGAAAMAAVMAEMQRIDRTYSPHRPDSELSRVNAAAATQPVRVSDELFQLVARAQEFSRVTQGAFDITYASAGALYDYRAGVLPDDLSLARAVQAIGWRHLQLDPSAAGGATLRFTRPGVRIDLGGFAKGHAVERCTQLLQRHGIRHAIVSAGGDSRLLGDRRGQPWTIAVRHPRQTDGVVALLPLQDVAVSTSGDYERCFLRDGVRHHHLLDPRTGRSPSHVRSVTVVAPDGLTAEALGKAVFVLGVERGLELVEQQADVDAVVVDGNGQLHCTRGFDALQTEAAGLPERKRVHA